jgi:(1->4)-alpha-D-glucan 1-alpha-D-glucosylmutase
LFTALWEEVSGEARGFHEIAEEAKREQARGPFVPDIERLAAAQPDLPADTDTLARAVASFPIYRTYVQPERGLVADADREAVHAAFALAARSASSLANTSRPPGARTVQLLGELAEMLLLERPAEPAFVTRFQQTTPPVVAKGVEDTAFYRYGRLLALCDVGGDPARFGIGVDRFHAANDERAERFPEAMLTTMTHDTKRSADVRARIAALTWMPELWDQTVRHWLSLTASLRSGEAPDDLERYFIFQTLAGAWPIEAERIEQYMEKALREAKRNTNWVDPNPEWEEAVKRFCRELYEHAEFRSSLEEFVRELEFAGDRIALGSVALKLTSPGVPDIYQGDEMPVRALVDPDNRRPVDWQWNETMLGRLAGGAPPEAETRKLWLTTRLLGLRIRRQEAFAGAFDPVDAGEDTVAYLRGGDVLVAVGTRPGVPAGALRGVSGRWRDVLYGEERDLGDEAALAELLDEYGIAVLERA